MQYNTQRTHRTAAGAQRWPLVVVAVLVVVAAVLLATELTNKTHFFHARRRTFAPTASPSTKGEPSTGGTTPSGTSGGQGGTSPAPQPGDNKGAGGSEPASLIVPSGPFVSNHHPNLSGSPAPNKLQSVCNTSPGASCTISFTKDGVTKSLPAQTADRGGATYWTWQLQDIGLTQGSWSIKATASSGSQTKSASDALALEVGP